MWKPTVISLALLFGASCSSSAQLGSLDLNYSFETQRIDQHDSDAYEALLTDTAGGIWHYLGPAQAGGDFRLYRRQVDGKLLQVRKLGPGKRMTVLMTPTGPVHMFWDTRNVSKKQKNTLVSWKHSSGTGTDPDGTLELPYAESAWWQTSPDRKFIVLGSNERRTTWADQTNIVVNVVDFATNAHKKYVIPPHLSKHSVENSPRYVLMDGGRLLRYVHIRAKLWAQVLDTDGNILYSGEHKFDGPTGSLRLFKIYAEGNKVVFVAKSLGGVVHALQGFSIMHIDIEAKTFACRYTGVGKSDLLSAMHLGQDSTFNPPYPYEREKAVKRLRFPEDCKKAYALVSPEDNRIVIVVSQTTYVPRSSSGRWRSGFSDGVVVSAFDLDGNPQWVRYIPKLSVEKGAEEWGERTTAVDRFRLHDGLLYMLSLENIKSNNRGELFLRAMQLETGKATLVQQLRSGVTLGSSKMWAWYTPESLLWLEDTGDADNPERSYHNLIWKFGE